MGGEVRKFRRKAAQIKRKADRKAQKHVSNVAEQVKEKMRVLISVPSVTGNVHASIAQLWHKTGLNNLDSRCPFYFMTQIVTGQRPIEYARNQISEFFMHETDAQWLVMIDEDQVVPDNWWELMTVGDADIVVGTTYCWVGNGYKEGRLRINQYGLKVSNQGTPQEKAECFNISPPDTNGKPYRIDIAGTGCIAIRRKVFYKLGCAPWKFTRYWNGRFRGAEDINFCVEARKAGFVIAAHPGVVFGHIKQMDLVQVSEYVAARLAMEKEGRTHKVDDMLSLG